MYAAAKNTVNENKANPPCKANTNRSPKCCIADWWSNPDTLAGRELHESRSITTLATFGGPLAPMFDFGWGGPDSDKGLLDGNPWGEFVQKSTMDGSATITFFDGWTAHFVLRGRMGSPFEGQLFRLDPALMMLLEPIVRPDGSEVFRQIDLAGTSTVCRALT